MELQYLDPLILSGFIFVLGLLVGSFLNVVIHRLPIMMETDWKCQCRELLELPEEEKPETYNLMVPRSACPKCGHQITALENIPVISWLALGGKCRNCKTPISKRYPLVELATAILSGVIAHQFGYGWPLAGALLFTWSLIALTMIDYDHQLLPDNITLPMLWIGIGFNFFGFFTSLENAVIGAIAGYMSLWTVYWVFKIATGKEGMGFGDFKLLGMLGAWMGWQVIPGVVILSSFVGAVFGIAMILFVGRDKSKPMPFGPYLATAGWIMFMWGDHINTAYLKLALG